MASDSTRLSSQKKTAVRDALAVPHVAKAIVAKAIAAKVVANVANVANVVFKNCHILSRGSR